MRRATGAAPRYSLVVALHNEAGNIPPLMHSALRVLHALPGDFEAILVNDGSTDATASELATVVHAEPRCRLITLPRNRGQATALWHGLNAARGELILTMDGDGQNDPRDFPALLAALDEQHAALACGWRHDRHDSLTRRLVSRLANAIRRRLLRDGVRDAGSQLRVLRRDAVAHLRPTPMLQTFLPAQLAAAGRRIVELPVRHHPRSRGRSHYGWRNLSVVPARELLREWLRRRAHR